MNPTETYEGFQNFWNEISAVVYIHILALLCLRYIGGIRFQPIERLTRFKDDAKYEKQRGVLKEFGLWAKLGYILFAMVLLYIVLFRSGVAFLYSIRPISLTYSLTDFWIEGGSVDDMTEIASYGPLEQLGDRDPNPYMSTINNVSNLYVELLNEIRAADAELYQRALEWPQKRLGESLLFYYSSILFVIIAAFLAVRPLRRSTWSLKTRLLTSLRLVIMTGFVLIVLLPLARYRSEIWMERTAYTETKFVIAQLRQDPKRGTTRLSPEQITSLGKLLCEEMRHTSVTPSQFWLTRELERALPEEASRRLETFIGSRSYSRYFVPSACRPEESRARR